MSILVKGFLVDAELNEAEKSYEAACLDVTVTGCASFKPYTAVFDVPVYQLETALLRSGLMPSDRTFVYSTCWDSGDDRVFRFAEVTA